MIDKDSLETIADSFELLARKELTKDHGIGFRVCVFTGTHMYPMPNINPNNRQEKVFLADMVRWFVSKYKGQAVALVSEAWVLMKKAGPDGTIDDLDEYESGKTGSLGDNPDSVEVMLISVTSPFHSVSRIKQFDRDDEGAPHNLRVAENTQAVDMASGIFSDFFGVSELSDHEKQIVKNQVKNILRRGVRLDRTGLKFAAPKSARLH